MIDPTARLSVSRQAIVPIRSEKRVTEMQTGANKMMARVDWAKEIVAKLKNKFFPNSTYDTFELRAF